MRYLLSVIILTLVLTFCSPVSAVVSTIVYPNGKTEVTVPASQYINVFSQATTNVYKQVGYPNLPSTFALETSGAVTNKSTSFGPYTYDTVVRIEAGIDGAIYSVGALAAAIPCEKFNPQVIVKAQIAPATMTTTATMLINDMMSGIITGTNSNGGATTYTLPTGTLSDTATGLSIDTGFEWSLINLSTAAADIITVAAGSGHTVVGSMAVPSAHASTGGVYGNAGRFFTRKTAANTFVTYRLN
jgi:hypothetical protein